MTKLTLIVPVYNEADTIGLFLRRVQEVSQSLRDVLLEILFVNDGSSDSTLETLLSRQVEDRRIRVVDLSRNFGKEAALTAGLHHATGDVVVPIDVDLQDPPELIPAMLEKWREGFDVVLGRRINRDSDTWAKRASANWFYRIHNQIATPELPENVGDFRLMDRQVVEALKLLPESRRFMKGLFAWIGFRTATVDYSRPPRAAGESKFNGWKLWNFALEGLTSFSPGLLKLWTYLGFLVAFAAFLFGMVIILKVLIHGVDVPGYASLMVTITFLGGLQLMGIGVVGEYLGRTYIESKRRPVYVVRAVHESPRDSR